MEEKKAFTGTVGGVLVKRMIQKIVNLPQKISHMQSGNKFIDN